MRIRFHKIGELNGSNYVKNPLRSNAVLKIENRYKNCSLCSISTYLHPCENIHPSRVENYRQNFKEIKTEDFDFTNGFKCSDVRKLEKTK